MKKVWFRELGWIYRPVTWQGWVATALTILFCVNVFLVIDRHSHSASDTLYGVFPYWVPAALILNWLAEKTCPK